MVLGSNAERGAGTQPKLRKLNTAVGSARREVSADPTTTRACEAKAICRSVHR